MRAILVDWLVAVHLKFKLRAETLYLAVNVVDRYLQRRQVPRARLRMRTLLVQKMGEVDRS